VRKPCSEVRRAAWGRRHLEGCRTGGRRAVGGRRALSTGTGTTRPVALRGRRQGAEAGRIGRADTEGFAGGRKRRIEPGGGTWSSCTGSLAAIPNPGVRGGGPVARHAATASWRLKIPTKHVWLRARKLSRPRTRGSGSRGRDPELCHTAGPKVVGIAGGGRLLTVLDERFGNGHLGASRGSRAQS